MGAFPSHDAPELIYTTVVTRPAAKTQVEVCLVPLLPRFFNDGHKKAKKKLNELLTGRGTSQSVAGRGAAAIGKGGDPAATSVLVDYFISGTEGFFYVNTKDAVQCKLSESSEQMQKSKGDADADGSTSKTGSMASDTHTTTSQQYSSQRASHNFTNLTVRPVPFAICLLDPEGTSNSSGSASWAGQSNSARNPHQQSQNGNTVLIKGRRLQFVGFISCCMDRQVRHMDVSNLAKVCASTYGGSGSCSGNGEAKKQVCPVMLDVFFDDADTYGFLMEPAVILASFAFRKQFVNSCALHFPAHDDGVEIAFERHMESLQLRLALRHNNYRMLRLFHSRYPLLDMSEELNMRDSGSAPHFSVYENSFGEYGLEVVFGEKFLSRWMRYVENRMKAEVVNGNHVRCNTADILQQRDRLIQERLDSGVALEDDDDERLFGGELHAKMLKSWIAAEKQPLKQRQQQMPLPGTPPMYVLSPAAAPNQFWPQMPLVMGQSAPWATGMVPFGAVPASSHPARHMPSVIGQQPQLVMAAPGASPQIYYATPQSTMLGNPTFIGPNAVSIVSQAAGTPQASLSVTPTQGTSTQQLVYVLPGSQVPQPGSITQPGAHAATAGATIAQRITPQTFFYPTQATYAVPYPQYAYPPPPPQQQVVQTIQTPRQTQQS
ncbi:hypothetical protein ERJ75_001027400 [Trypanosoma vivax]|uniref:Uncharacterized protein n=1 Tax=Trypanosoma vivax (strain Y486) TaxID=1055687 RepID=G0TR50_TRYVY|nr:hypothetical protein TRVL_01617 [Trypanosoma vivax]KAH8611915.1 hypothetical protein ERJ75_001027400 [Trypanosoma vivax]CCC46414.1 conserved hypothetical protein [Trypanosoma vivax Y486]